MVRLTQKGDFSKTFDFLQRCLELTGNGVLDRYGELGVKALSEATPRDTGKTAESWSYEIVRKKGSVAVQWKNSNIVNGVCIAIILQYGHATRNYGYVLGRDYINPALKPIFDEMADKLWKEVTGK